MIISTPPPRKEETMRIRMLMYPYMDADRGENLDMIWYVGGVRPQSVYNGRPELGSDCYGEPHLLSFLPPISYIANIIG